MNQLKLLIAAVAVLNHCSALHAQLTFEYSPTIPVYNGVDSMSLAWAGGLSFPQFSDFDYDFDGDMDLFLFDRSSDNIAVLIQENDVNGPYYRYDYSAKNNFPPGLQHMAMLVDYDNDGKKDLFTANTNGLRVYRNVGNAINGIQWVLFKDLLYSQYPSTFAMLNTSAVSDIPALVDVDLDGDMDVLNFDAGGGRYVEYHQNQSMDIYGIPDSLEFIQKNECWGKFSEAVASNSIILNDPFAPCVGGNIPNPESGVNNALGKSSGHSGSSILAIDYDNSGVLDLIIGDASYFNLSLLINGGTAVNTDSPMISVDYNFPSNTTPVDMFVFPAAFYVDVDFDNVKDLLVTPSNNNGSMNRKSIWFYKNMGTNANPNFIYVKDNFLQDIMIEHGKGTVPVVFDFNEDGLQDLMVANFNRYKSFGDKESVIAYYRNTGTNTQPSYQLIDDDVFNLQVEPYGLRIIPTFGDVDGDGDEDMFLGFEDGSLAYYQNYSTGGGSDFFLDLLTYTDAFGNPINTGGFCHPQLFDINDDGLLDLLLGTKSGEIQYYQNIGDINNPLFELINPSLGGVAVNSTTPDGYAAPNFFRHNGSIHLFVGSIDGNIGYYDSIESNLAIGTNFNLVSSNYLDIQVGGYSACWVGEIDSDTTLNMFVGQDLGGLYHFEVDTPSTIGITENVLSPELLIYPNPSNEMVTISLVDESGELITLCDVRGEVILEESFNTSKTISLSPYSNGVYFIKVLTENGNTVVKKLIKQ